MNPKDLNTSAKNTWCPGCGNFSILSAMRTVLAQLDEEGFPIENVVLVSGIGCHAKIVDYMNVNSFYSIHGRTLPVATAIKLANPDLKVICFSGDGDSLAEGTGPSHLRCQEEHRHNTDPARQPGLRLDHRPVHTDVPAGLQRQVHARGLSRASFEPARSDACQWSLFYRPGLHARD